MRKKILIIFGILALIVITIYGAIQWIISPMYSNKLDIVEKSVNTEENNKDTSETIELNDTNIESDNTDNIVKEEQKEDEILNILLCGMDARRYETNSRSDTIILASYNITKHEVKLVSFMRDSWVHLPEYGWSRINAATAYGGTGLLVNTINHNFDLDVQNYVQIKFDDFKAVIDILGGIEVELTQEEINYINRKLHQEDKDWSNDIKEKPGIINLNGAQALWHCRNRSVGNSDFERTDRQREVLTLLINKAINMKIGQATSIVFELRKHINTNLDMNVILNLGYDALISKNITVETTRIPFDGEFWSANKNGASVLELDIEDNTRMLHEFLGYDIQHLDDVGDDDVSEYVSESEDEVGEAETTDKFRRADI